MKLSKAHRKKIESALVHIETKGGRGTLVFGEFVLTAAHCLKWDPEGPMALGDWFPEPIKTSGGQSFILTPVAVEPLSDIAVLGEIDDQEYPEDADKFEEFRNGTEPIELCKTKFKRGGRARSLHARPPNELGFRESNDLVFISALR